MANSLYDKGRQKFAEAGINWLTHPGNWWVLWVALVWGCILLIRTIKTIGWIPFLGPQWERRQVEKRLGRKLV